MRKAGSSIHTIYLADDDPDDQQLLQNAFLQVTDNHHLKIFNNGKSLLELISGVDDCELPCLIVLDSNMHGMSGRDTLAILQRTARYRDIPKIIYTTSNALLDRVELIALGARDFITKEVTFQGILKSARKMLTYCSPFRYRNE